MKTRLEGIPRSVSRLIRPLQISGAVADSGGVLASVPIQRENVVPGRHGQSAVDCDRRDRCVGQYEAHGHREIHLPGQRSEVMTVSAQTVEKNQRPGRVRTRTDFNRIHLRLLHPVLPLFW